MKEEDRKEMKKTTKDIRKMFQDKISKGGPTTTPVAATTTTSSAARWPPTKVSHNKTVSNLCPIKRTEKLCASPDLICGTTDAAVSCETIWSRPTETGRGGGGGYEGGVGEEPDGGRGADNYKRGVVVVKSVL